MATSLAPPPKETDPFLYGWRFVKVIGPDGEEGLEQVPLTLEDVLHPQEDDHISDNTLHGDDSRHVADTFNARKSRLDRGLVLANCLVDWGVPGVGNHSPDLCVFERLRMEPPQQLGIFRVLRYGARCVLALEFVSPHSRETDVTFKFEEYHRVGVPLYVIVDQKVENGPRQLLAYRHEPSGYTAIPLDEQGRLLIEPLGLYLAIRDNRVVCFDAASGELLGDYVSLSQELEQTHQELKQSHQELKQARDTLEKAEEALTRERQAQLAKDQRIRELEEQLRRSEP